MVKTVGYNFMKFGCALLWVGVGLYVGGTLACK